LLLLTENLLDKVGTGNKSSNFFWHSGHIFPVYSLKRQDCLRITGPMVTLMLRNMKQVFSHIFATLCSFCVMYYCGGMACRVMQYVRRAMSNSEKLELIVVNKSRVLGSPCASAFFLVSYRQHSLANAGVACKIKLF